MRLFSMDSSTLWRNPDFMKLWTGQTISVVCSRLDGLGLTALLVLGASPAQMGFLAAAGGLPALAVSLFAGALLDRTRRKPVMIAADLGRAAALLIIPLAVLFGGLNLLLLLGIVIVHGALTIVFEVGYRSYLPSLVERKNILEGNSKLAVSSSLAEVTGPGLGGFLVQTLTAPVAILVDGLSFLVSAGSLIWIRKPELSPVPTEADRPLLNEIRAGLSFVFSHPILRPLALYEAQTRFFGSFFAGLYSLYALRTLGLGPALLGLVITCGGVGSLLGAFVSNRLIERVRIGPILLVTSLGGWLAAFLIPLASGPVWRAALMMAAAQVLGDVLGTIYEVNQISLAQSITPDVMLGRMNSSLQFLAAGIGPFGALAGGLIAELAGVRPAIFVAAAGGFLAGLWLLFSSLPGLKNQLTSRD
jgi:MFS family permease